MARKTRRNLKVGAAAKKRASKMATKKRAIGRKLKAATKRVRTMKKQQQQAQQQQ